MDREILVRSGHALGEAFQAANLSARAMIWVYSSDTDTWKLWVVPHVSIKDKREFYRRVSEFISNDRQKFGGIDSGDVELMSEDHPAIRALRRAFKVRGKSDIHISGNMLNGFYLPEGIILLLDL